MTSSDSPRYPDNLTDAERIAIRRWLNVGYDSLRGYQLNGRMPPNDELDQFDSDLASALKKAPICTEVVFRGLSAGSWRPTHIAHLRSRIEEVGELVLRSHESASSSEAIGHSFARTEEDDEERHLALLMRIKPLTARALAPLDHAHGSEDEVVLLQGSLYKRTGAQRMPDPKPHLEYWETDWVELA